MAIVTGAAKGIGLGIAEVLSAEGARVVIADLDLDAATEAAQTVVHHGGEAIDGGRRTCARRATVEMTAAAALDRWGRIDILAANAGIYPHTALVDLDQEGWDRMMAINVRGAVFAIQACLAAR